MGRGVQRVEDLINPPNPIDLRPSGWTRSPLRVGFGFISNKTRIIGSGGGLLS